jgi:serine/threonine protein kinase
MNSPLAAGRAPGGVDRVDEAVKSFEAEWRRNGNVRLEDFWAARRRDFRDDSPDALALLAELVKTELRCRFDRGETPTVAAYLERFPELRGTDSRVLSLIYEEFCLGEERGHTPDVDAFCGRYPQWKDSLVSQLQYHRAISQAAEARPKLPPFPEAGERFEEFELISTMGRGGTSRVYLARDLSLGGKQVVLKVSLDRGQEPQVQGRLLHPHIVPVNSVTFAPEHRLRGLSMPFQPGLTLDVIIARIAPAARHRKAIALWRALVDGAAKGLIPCAVEDVESLLRDEMRRVGPRGDGWEGFPIRGTYAQGAAWIAMIVARALHYAHQQQTYHRDVKPANVLLTLAHGPQLFDFNLADSPHSADRAQEALRGGTLPYMAPEQIAAFLDPELWGNVGAPADVYSLGLVLRELLTGQQPELPDATLSPALAMRHLLDRRSLLDTGVRRVNPAITHALDVIVGKSLALLPGQRYSSAEAMAQDLECFLTHQPLRHAVNPSRRERLGNWLTRQRRTLTAAAAALVAGVVIGSALSGQIYRTFFRPPLTSSLPFQAAYDAIYNGRPELAINPLVALDNKYSELPLLGVHIGLALGTEDDAATRVAGALAAPGAERGLLAWGKARPAFIPCLVDWTGARLEHADRLAAAAVLAEEEEDYRSAREPDYNLARKVLRLVAALDPGSLGGRLLRARLEEFDACYQAAFDNVCRAIDGTRERLVRQSDPDYEAQMELLFASQMLRCRIATSWADRLRNQGSTAGRQQALDILVREERDLRRYRGFVDPLQRDSSFEDRGLKEYNLYRNELRLMLTLAELEIERGLPNARAHIDAAENAMAGLVHAAKASSLALPKPFKFNKRLGAARERLAARTSGSEDAPTKTNSIRTSQASPSGL